MALLGRQAVAHGRPYQCHPVGAFAGRVDKSYKFEKGRSALLRAVDRASGLLRSAVIAMRR